MGVETVRLDTIEERIKKCQELLNREEYLECERELDSLENEIGTGDPEISKLRNILFFEQD